MTHQIYSRLLNPTSVSLANAIVDLEAGPYTADYMAWNFNSGMAAIDALLSNVLNRGDVLIVSRNVYGGVHQLLVDYFAREEKLDIKLEWFDGYSAEAFKTRLDEVKDKYAKRLKTNNLHVYLESPCNPHGYVLDVPEICRIAHADGDHLVMLDSTLATPVLNRPLQHENKAYRPDYVIHSYTKDISGSGSVTSGTVIGEAYRMFIPKGDEMNGLNWAKSMFWDVYYIKGAFLDSDKAYDVLIGMKTLEQRMINKAINTIIFTRFLASHPDFRVNSHALENNENYALKEKCLTMGLPSALFTVDMEGANLDRSTFTKFFDSLEPGFSLMVSIGQCNTMILCPALTSHSELSAEDMARARIYPTTMRISMGNENIKDLIASFIHAAKLHIEPVRTGFVEQFLSPDEIDKLVEEVTVETHRKLVRNQPSMREMYY
jgi:cystathionine beta-lyase/cystathionine gamma-synthase